MGFSASVVVRAEEVYERLSQATTEEEAIEAMRGESIDVFRFIDEKPGWFPGNYCRNEGWRMLRCARNNPESNLFEALV